MSAELENFDELFVGNPIDIERNLIALLPAAQSLENKSIYLQIFSQIALSQAMQKKFVLAHKTLDDAEKNLTDDYSLARVRIILERGRIFHQAGESDKALTLFEESYHLSKSHNFDYHTINAAHMVAIVVKNTDEKIKWNQQAISIANKTQDIAAKAWLGALYNNIAQNYIDAEQFSEALDAFKKSKEFAELRGDHIVIRGAQWGIARSLRSLNCLEEAIKIQLSLLDEYAEIVRNSELPMEIIVVGRGMIYEELAEIHLAYAKNYATLAYNDLSQDPWCVQLIPDRLEKMKRLKDGINQHLNNIL